MSILINYIKKVIEEKVDKESSFMVALYPNQETIDKFIKFRSQKLSIPPNSKIHSGSEVHNTIRYWEFNEEKVSELIEKLKKYKFKNPVKAKPIKIQKLGDSISLMLESDIVQHIFYKIDTDMESIGLPPSDYPEYLAHMAFYYSDDIDESHIPEDLNVDFDIVFTSIKLVDQDDKVLWEIKCD